MSDNIDIDKFVFNHRLKLYTEKRFIDTLQLKRLNAMLNRRHALASELDLTEENDPKHEQLIWLIEQTNTDIKLFLGL